MGVVRPWSFSSLETFKSCGRKYHEENILKTVARTEDAAQTYGLRVHKAFEHNQDPSKREPLPSDLRHHQSFMDRLDVAPGYTRVERKVALTKELMPCSFFDKDVWWRGVIDYEKLSGHKARVVDYKTGKQHQKYLQLHLFCMYLFAEDADIEEAEAGFYWTQTLQYTPITLKRDRMIPILRSVMPDLQQWVEAHKNDIWQPRPNGLCKKYCGVTNCEFHGLGR